MPKKSTNVCKLWEQTTNGFAQNWNNDIQIKETFSEWPVSHYNALARVDVG